MAFRDENLRFAKQVNVSPEAFSRPTITVELGPDAAKHQGNVSAFLLALNLVSRTFHRVYALFPPEIKAPNHPWNLITVGSIVDELNDTVEGTIHVGSPEHSDVVLSIGARPSISAKHGVIVHGTHWRAALDCDLPGAGEGTLGLLYAACMGAAQVLLHVLSNMTSTYRPMPPFTFSLLDLLRDGAEGDMPKEITLPEAHLVGVGAVGSAAIYALSHFGRLSGDLHLIDNEKVDDSNLNRYVLMRRRDLRRWKVDVASEALAQTSVQRYPYRDSFSCYAGEYGANVNLLLSPVDSKEGRRELARMLPCRVVNAATGGTSVTVSTHGFNDGKACLHCLYPVKTQVKSLEETMAVDLGLPLKTVLEYLRTNAPVNPELVARIEKNRGVEPGRWAGSIGSPIDSFYNKAVCGEAELQLPTANVIAPLAFISVSAGILLAVELIKIAHPELRKWELNNYFRVDTFAPPNLAFRQLRRQDASGNCICGDPDYVSVYSQKYGVDRLDY